MKNKVCFVIPTYPAHFLYAIELLKNFKNSPLKEQADLFFVFTSEMEKDGFLDCNSLVIPKKLRNVSGGGIINIKKFYALMKLKDSYDYIIALDDEVYFDTTNIDLLQVCEKFFSCKKLLGNPLIDPPLDIENIIIKNCRRFIPKNSINKSNLYLWWNQIPIYDTSHLSDFFQITSIDKNISKLKWGDFDYYIYMHYLISYHNFEIIDIGIATNRAFSELTPESPLKKLASNFEPCDFYMSTDYAKKKLKLSSVFIILHTDRDIEFQEVNMCKKIVSLFSLYRHIRRLITFRSLK